MSHNASRADKRFAYEVADYVNEAWVAATLARQRGQCAECQSDLGEVATGLWSIDRVDNDQPHTKGNCRLVCHVRKATEKRSAKTCGLVYDTAQCI